jgi:hypothetical protein
MSDPVKTKSSRKDNGRVRIEYERELEEDDFASTKQSQSSQLEFNF